MLRRLGHDVFRLSTPAAADDPDRGAWLEAGFAANTTVDAIVRASRFVPDLLLYDVAFVSQIGLQSRREVIDRLSARWKMNERRQYLQHEIGGVYGRAKIVLNLPLADDLNFRTFEAMSCGAMLLTSRIQNGQERLFEDGVHYASYSTLDEIPDRVAYYLEHDEERERIAAAGLAAIRQRHSLDLRLTQLIDTVASHPERPAPVRAMSAAARDRQFAWLYEYWSMVEPGLTLAREARRAGRSWWPLLVPVGRTVLRQWRSA